MAYRLDKPCSRKERADFISVYNHAQGLQIYETEDVIYALEPNEIVKDGEIIVDPDYDAKQLEKAKEEKVVYNDLVRDQALLSGVTYQNVLFDSDTDQKINLLATVGTMGDTDTIVWYGMDNQGLLCSKEDLVNIGQQIIQLHSFCWNMNAHIKEQIQEAQTLEELEGIDIDYTIPDEDD